MCVSFCDVPPTTCRKIMFLSRHSSFFFYLSERFKDLFQSSALSDVQCISPVQRSYCSKNVSKKCRRQDCIFESLEAETSHRLMVVWPSVSAGAAPYSPYFGSSSWSKHSCAMPCPTSECLPLHWFLRVAGGSGLLLGFPAVCYSAQRMHAACDTHFLMTPVMSTQFICCCNRGVHPPLTTQEKVMFLRCCCVHSSATLLAITTVWVQSKLLHPTRCIRVFQPKRNDSFLEPNNEIVVTARSRSVANAYVDCGECQNTPPPSSSLDCALWHMSTRH